MAVRLAYFLGAFVFCFWFGDAVKSGSLKRRLEATSSDEEAPAGAGAASSSVGPLGDDDRRARGGVHQRLRHAFDPTDAYSDDFDVKSFGPIIWSRHGMARHGTAWQCRPRVRALRLMTTKSSYFSPTKMSGKLDDSIPLVRHVGR